MFQKVLSSAVGMVLAMTFSALAQGNPPTAAFPTKPMTMIIPFAAGGPQDVLGRILAQRLSEVLGQQVVIENIGGAGGQTGSRRVADATPDGYVFGIGSVGTHAQNQTLFKRPLYDAATDFTPVALVAESPIALMTRNDLPVTNFKEFLAYAKANQAKMQFASAGAGSATHVACVVLNYAMGVDITHVPYRGTGPAMQDLAGGRVDYMCDFVATSKPQIDGGTVKGIALLNKERSPVLPNLATALEQGTDVQTYAWTAIFLPKHTPDAIVQKLNQAILQAMHTPIVQTRISELGSTIVPDDRATPQYLGQFVKSEIEKWAGPIKASGVTIE
jgi:tripartite-type tricarboxylate transporter receptor subunit TctC